jgi:integrase/recombinase XerC/integrase/recombinase XerD
MGKTVIKDQWTIQNLSQEYYIPVAVESFLIDRKAQNMAAGTLYFYKMKLKLFFEFCERQFVKSIGDITPDFIRQYLFYLEQTGHNPGGIHACYRTLRTFMYWFEEEYEPEGWKNPIRKVKAPRLAQEPLQPISKDDFEALIATCEKTWHGARDKAILLTLLDSGLRASELTALNLADLDVASGTVEVRKGKGRKPRVTFVGSVTRRAVRRWLAFRGSKAGALFTTQEEERLSYWGLRQIVRRRAEQAGIVEPGLHDFRRAFCLAQLQAGVPETTIARLMGHTTTQLITRYARQTGNDIHRQYYSTADDVK